MNQSTAERWVTISAFVVLAVYGYRRIVEPAQQGNVKNIIGIGNPVPLGQFITAWGFCYFVVAIMASASPQLGGSFAILIMVSDLLTNAPSLLPDVAKQEGAPTTPNSTTGAAEVGATPGVMDTASGLAPYKPPTNLPNPVK